MNETIMIDLGMDNHEIPEDYRERINEQLRDLYNRINAYTTKWRTNGN